MCLVVYEEFKVKPNYNIIFTRKGKCYLPVETIYMTPNKIEND